MNQPITRMILDKPIQRLRLTIQGAVQGVGFRPFIYRLATELGLVGWVNNSAQGVFIEVEKTHQELERFRQRIEQEKPPLSFIQSIEASFLDPVGYTKFEIRPSVVGEKTALVIPDIATCPDCFQEIFEPTNRRYLYPFANCTNCGPRYSIIKALPYDRCNTTMKGFEMCSQCQSEYENPLDRRFHAQPNACPQCGPQLALWDGTGKVLASRHHALLAATAAINQGKIVAVKGLGGFHLMVDACNEAAVKRLRQRKGRPEKPLALMFPNLALVKEHCQVTELEARLLRSPQAPIVLLRRQSENRNSNQQSPIAPAVAPGNPDLGVILPYTPLHHLLMAQLGRPIVATSGNISDEPICTNEHDALKRLGNLADLFLVHNRPITRPIDDSIVRVIMGRELVLRRARGYAPLPIGKLVNSQELESEGVTVESSTPKPTKLQPILAVGAHLKNTIAITSGNQVFVSQHIGDLQTSQACDSFQQTIANFEELYEFQPAIVACDAHPDYRSTQFAQQLGIPVVSVQHHYAHVLSCMAENELDAPLLGVAWDGTGYGEDGTIWGGEFLKVTQESFARIAHWRNFRLPGGDKAVKEPRRVALGLLYEFWGEAAFERKELYPIKAFSGQEQRILKTMLARSLNTPLTSSAGRLFDAIASLMGLTQEVSFEGQAAMALEFALDGVLTEANYSFQLQDKSHILDTATSSAQTGKFPMVVNWATMVEEIISDVDSKTPVSIMAAKFHNTLVEVVIAVAKSVGEEKVVLSGGCFQNRYLTERAISRLSSENFRPYWHQRIPPNDGGIALGQIMAAKRHLQQIKHQE
ncbi:carbamoyltransferase HypF [Lyngbya aestuarii]|uniref:carbamoyltransferase HypF n=1 Tax=Lyngbya aestuarii TaxID=118322 RepID=UPI00403E2227